MPKFRAAGSSSPTAVAAGDGIYISEQHACSEAYQLSLTKGPAIAAFLQHCISQKDGFSVFQIPRNSGNAIHSDPWASRVADCAVVSSTKSFLSPLEEVVASISPIMTTEDVAKALDASAGVVSCTLSLCENSIQQLEIELERRLSYPWLSREAIRQRRVCVLMWSRIAVKRASWAAVKALGLKVVVMSSGPWLKADKSPQEYGLDGYIDADMTTDSGLWRRVVDAVESYPDPIDGLCGPWDPYMVPTARAARHLGFFTPGPEPFTISTSKYLTRQMLDPEQKEYFTVTSLNELELRLESSHTIAFPIVCKPVAGMGSFGVFKADNVLQLRDAVSKSLIVSKATTDPRIVVEPYVDGPEVDCNLVLLNGEVLFSEIVDDFPCAADLAKNPTGALFTETQAAVPSKLPKSEQKTITDAVVAAVRQQGFDTGVFHCEARIRNSSMKYVFAESATVPDLEFMETVNCAKGNSVFLHEVNARMPGPMSSGATIIARGVDFSALMLLCAVGDWSRYKALSVPFLRDDLCDNVWLINCIVPVSLDKIKPLFPDHPADQLQHQAVDSSYSPILELSKTHPHLTQHVSRHNVYIEPATVLGGKEGDWLWTACIVIRSPISRQHALQMAQSLPEIYEAFVKQKYSQRVEDTVALRSHFL